MHLYQRMERPVLPVDALALHLLQPGQTRPPDPRNIQRLLKAMDTQGYAYGSLLPVQVCLACGSLLPAQVCRDGAQFETKNIFHF